jgi:hypothetical protein
MGIVHDRACSNPPEWSSGLVIEVIRSRNLDPTATIPTGVGSFSETGPGSPEDRDPRRPECDVDPFRRRRPARHRSPWGSWLRRPTDAAAEARGYGNLEVMGAMLTGISDIEFN